MAVPLPGALPRPALRAPAAPWTLLLAATLYAAGMGLLARAYGPAGDLAAAFGRYWVGLGLCFAGTAVLGLAPGARPRAQVAALALLGAALYVPTYLRSPAFPLFQDELFHIQTLRLMHDLKTTRVPTTLFPIAGEYPGLEDVGLATVYATGWPVDAVVRLVPLFLHALIPLLAYAVLRAAGLRPAAACFGGLLYIANSSYAFFHATFSYESIGIALFLLVALFAARLAGPERAAAAGTTVLLLVAVAGVVASHHVSGLIAAVLLVVFAVAVRLARRLRLRPVGVPMDDVALFAVVAWTGWLAYQTSRTVFYLAANFVDRAAMVASFLLAEQRQPRQLFWNSSSPPFEQLVAYAYPVLVALLAALGVLRTLRHWPRLWPGILRRFRAAAPAGGPWARAAGGDAGIGLPVCRLALFVVGPLLWVGTGPLILSRSSDAAYRAWPFLFLGVAFYAAVGVAGWLDAAGRAAVVRRGALAVVAGLAIAGGSIIGDNQAGRLRTPELRAAAGPEALTPDVVAAAGWLESTAGRFNVISGDKGSAVALSVFGMQRPNPWANWIPFYTTESGEAQYFLDANGVRFVAVDLRTSRLLPRYGVYFDEQETEFVPPAVHEPGTVIPLDRLEKFDRMPRLRRIYDNGNIVLYANEGGR